MGKNRKKYVQVHKDTCGFAVIDGCLGSKVIKRTSTYAGAMRWARKQHRQSVASGGPKWHIGVRV